MMGTGSLALMMVGSVAGGLLVGQRAVLGQAGSGPGRNDPVPSVSPGGGQTRPGSGGGVKERPAAEPQPPRVDLRPKFEVGQTTRYVWVLRSEQVLPVGGGDDGGEPLSSTLRQEIGLKMVTRGVDAQSGVATVELVYERVKASIDSALGKIEFDSTAKGPGHRAPGKGGGAPASADPLDALDPEKMIADHFAKMVGTTLEMKVGRDGRIAEVKGGGSLVPPGLGVGGAGVGGGLDPSAALGGLFGPISTQSTPGFDGTAKVGDRWTHTSGVSVGPLGGLDVRTSYELRSHSGGVAQVYFSGSAGSASPGQSPGPSPSQAPAGTGLGPVEARQSGSYRWDTRLGQLSRAEFEQSTSIALPGGLGGGGKPMIGKTTVTIERSK